MGNEGTQSSLLLGVICPQHPRGRQSRTPKREGKSYMSSKEVLDTKNDLIEGDLESVNCELQIVDCGLFI
jgi:hypothetical protein